ncbi:MAG: TonB-dependent receptor, partial [Bacteroidota bacterium]
MVRLILPSGARALLLALLSIAAAIPAVAQNGTVTGRVTDAVSGGPLAGATIRLTGGSATTRQGGAISARDGRYTMRGIPPGRYRVQVSFIGYGLFESDSLELREGGTLRVDAVLKEGTLNQSEVVVSASRRPEKITSAPASVTVVDPRHIEERTALSGVDHLRSVPGLDIVQSGLTQNMVVARGFNNAFSGTLMTLVDNRIASVPSLRFNAHNFIPIVNEDLQQIEVIRGPGSALYGPNTANGVLHMITRSPFASTGAWLSLAGGERGVVQGMGRFAGTIGDRLGYKVSGQYMQGEDWGYVDSVEVIERARAIFVADSLHAGLNPDTLKIGLRDSTIRRVGGELRVDYIPTDDMTLIFQLGANAALRNPEITGVGGAQARNWLSNYYQVRGLYKDFFVQAFLNQSNAGESYTLRTGQPLVDRSTLFVVQAQHSTAFEGIGRLAYGVDYLHTTPVTDGTITGRFEANDDIVEVGGYLQGEAMLARDLLELVVAGRLDHHSKIDGPIFSPRAALVYTPTPDQTIRATFNRAYSAPTTNDLFLDFIGGSSQGVNVRASGVPPEGFTFSLSPTNQPYIRSYAALGQDPNRAFPLDSLLPIWRKLQDTLRPLSQGFGASLDSVPPPPASVVELRQLNQQNRQFDPSRGAFNVPSLKPTINSTIELGYKGLIAERFSISVDLYRSQYDNFIGPLQVITPNAFFNRDSLYGYLLRQLQARGADTSKIADALASISSFISTIPIGTVAPNVAGNPYQASNPNDPAAILLSSRNYGSITLYGCDISMQAAVADGLTLSGSFSYTDKNFFRNLDNVSDLSLNSPKFKYTLGAEYRNATIGFNGDVRLRHVDGFPVNSGVYVGDVLPYS